MLFSYIVLVYLPTSVPLPYRMNSCRRSIPHISELAKAHTKVYFVGVSDEPEETVMPFVTQMGSNMEYNIALDVESEAREKVMFVRATAYLLIYLRTSIHTQTQRKKKKLEKKDFVKKLVIY